MNITKYIVLACGLLLMLTGCTPAKQTSSLKESLTFYASFDGGTDADYALGDAKMYTAPSRKALDSAQAGLHNVDHKLLEGQGQKGDAFQFGKKSQQVIYYKSKDNINYNGQSWSGTISFWLSLDPATDLEPGYTDPIQITDVNYNDASIWVDFTNENPRDFRLGVIGDLAVWSLDTLKTSNEEEFERRLVRVKNPPFSKGTWTHIAITYSALGTEASSATLYLNGQSMGSVEGIPDPFTWDLDQSNIYLGLNFIGLMDELSIYSKPLSKEEVKEIYELDGGVSSIL
ncbi:MAG: LamG domain-containing protein [Cyclobacteriaceae bacterium]